MLDGWKRERAIRRALHGIAKQRVAVILQPGNFWVIENVRSFEGKDKALSTCCMRGWIESLHEALPHQQLTDVCPNR